MNIAFIPVRGGSKSIPLKNIKHINGKPLVYWTIKAACECDSINRVFVSTDSEDIRKTVEEFCFDKVTVIERSKESATDTASTEFAMLEFAQQYEFDNIVLVQATSPLLKASDLDNGFKIYNKPDTDSVLSVVKQKRFNWTKDNIGNARPTNYNILSRPRRQEFEGYFVENGAFYITSKIRLLQSQNRISGNIKLVEMGEDTFYEIDEPGDWTIIEALMKKDVIISNREPEQINIKMFLTDCDGCLTDGGMYYSERGDEIKKFNARDGKGFELLRKAGIITGIVTSEDMQMVRNRADKLKLDIVRCGVQDKLRVIKDLAKEYGITLRQIAYVGDDINDLEVIKQVGLGCSVADGLPQVKAAAEYVTSVRGGEGAIREIVEVLILKGKRVNE